MRIIARRSLREFRQRHLDSEQALKAWFAEVETAAWKTSAAVKAKCASASILGGERIIFNICGNKYRLIVGINYIVGVVFIKFIGTHRAYDRIDAETVEWKRKS